jgi:hypothetical protein
MSYCRKCGAQLDEGAKFCHVCGTPTDVTAAPRYERRRRRMPILTTTIILIAILLTAFIVIGLFTFIPIYAVNVKESREAPYRAGIKTLNLNFTADIAQVNITFESLTGKLVVLNVSATGGVGMFASPKAVNVTFDYAVNGNVLTVTSKVDTTHNWPWSPWLHVACDLHVDPSMNTSLNAKTSVGTIFMNTKTGVVLNALSLEAITGGIEANLAKGVIVNGNISVKTTTGGVDFSWNNVKAKNNITVSAKTTTGGIALDVLQNETIPANVTMDAEATTGGINLNMAVHDSVGAYVTSSTTIGGINVNKNGFNGTKSPLQSSNYPAESNFIISLKTTTGGVNIDAEYTTDSILSS